MYYEGFLTKKQMEATGWTKKMFADHLPNPHKTVPNPANPNWAPMGLYDKKVVQEIESTPHFQSYKEWTVGFRARMREVASEASKRRASRMNAEAKE